jgi:hypothetical protein
MLPSRRLLPEPSGRGPIEGINAQPLRRAILPIPARRHKAINVRGRRPNPRVRIGESLDSQAGGLRQAACQHAIVADEREPRPSRRIFTNRCHPAGDAIRSGRGTNPRPCGKKSRRGAETQRLVDHGSASLRLRGRFSTNRFHPAGDAIGIRRGTHPRPCGKNSRRGAETQRLVTHVSASQRLRGRISTNRFHAARDAIQSGRGTHPRPCGKKSRRGGRWDTFRWGVGTAPNTLQSMGSSRLRGFA